MSGRDRVEVGGRWLAARERSTGAGLVALMLGASFEFVVVEGMRSLRVFAVVGVGLFAGDLDVIETRAVVVLAHALPYPLPDADTPATPAAAGDIDLVLDVDAEAASHRTVDRFIAVRAPHTGALDRVLY